MQPDGKTIVLTGGRGGIGTALAERLGAQGARLLIVDRAPGPGVIEADLSDPAALDRVCARIAQEPVDILINLAGLMYFGHLTGQQAGHLDAMIRVNLEAPIRLSQAVLPGMIARGRGQIVNIGSVFGALPFPHFASYSATKAGLKGFSDALRREYAGKGITVSHCAPRAVATALNSGLIPELHRRTGVVSDTPDMVADMLLAAIRDDRKSLTIGFPERLFVRLNAVLPGLIDRGLRSKRDIADRLLDTPHATPHATPGELTCKDSPD